MSTGSFFSSATSIAFLTGSTGLPMSGPLPPACEVEKNTGSTWDYKAYLPALGLAFAAV